MKTLISRRSFLKAAGVLGAAAALSACGGSNSSASAGASADGTVKLTMSLQDNTSSNYYQGALKIAECVEKATNGQITMTVQAGGTLAARATAWIWPFRATSILHPAQTRCWQTISRR